MKKYHFTVLFIIFCIHLIFFFQDSLAGTKVATDSCGNHVTWKLTSEEVLRISGAGEITGDWGIRLSGQNLAGQVQMQNMLNQQIIITN